MNIVAEILMPDGVEPTREELKRCQCEALDPIRQAAIVSQRRFVEGARRHLKGRVLDYGAGKPGTCRQPQPYRDLIDGDYVPFDLGDPDPKGPFDAILCTQVLQYVECKPSVLGDYFYAVLRPGGVLVATIQTNWPEVEGSDRWRFTLSGIIRLLNARQKGLEFEIAEFGALASVKIGRVEFITGWGVIAIKE